MSRSRSTPPTMTTDRIIDLVFEEHRPDERRVASVATVTVRGGGR